MCFVLSFAEKKDFFEPVNQLNFSYKNENWTVSEEEREPFEILRLQHKDTSAQFKLYSYVYSEPITIEDFISRRIGQGYDGWRSLGQREAKTYELTRANVDAGFLTIQVKAQALDESDSHKKEDQLVVEYYFVYGEKKGVVLSLKLKKQDWPRVKLENEELVKSFWIGMKKHAIQIGDSNEYPDEWRMMGQGIRNHQSIKQKLDVGTQFVVKWKKKVESSLLKDVSPLVLKKNFFLPTKKGLEKRNAKTGELFWSQSNIEKIRSDMAYIRQALFFYAYDNKKNKKIISVSSHTGELRFKKSLDQDVFGHPVVYGQSVFSVAKQRLYSFSLNTGQQQWVYQTEGVILAEPVIFNSLVLIMEKSKMVGLDLDTGLVQWTYMTERAMLHRPVMLEDAILMSNSVSKNIIELNVMDLKNQHSIWKNMIVLDEEESISQISYNHQLVIVLSQKASNVVARVFDDKTGELILQKMFPKSVDKGSVLVFENALLYAFSIENVLHVSVLDLETSEIKTLPLKELDVQAISDIQWIRPSDDILLCQFKKSRLPFITAVSLKYKE